jgi:hypothetical protein
MEHYRRTVQNPVKLPRLAPLLEALDLAELSALFPDGLLRVFGVSPGIANRNKKKWDQFEAGDLVLFCGQGGVFASSFLKYKMHNRQVALALWKTDEEGQTWEFLYFVSQFRSHRISYPELAAAAGYSSGFVVLGVSILNENKSARVMTDLGLVDD